MWQSRACSHPFRTLRTLWIRSGLRGPEAQRQDRQGQMCTKGRRNQFPHMEPAFEGSLAHWRCPYNSILASFLALRLLGSILVPLGVSSRDFCSHDRHERPSHIECWINTLQETVRNFPNHNMNVDRFRLTDFGSGTWTISLISKPRSSLEWNQMLL